MNATGNSVTSYFKHALRSGTAATMLMLAACTPAEQRAAAPQAGLPAVVSLNPCLDGLLVELAGPDQIIALSHYSRDPAASSIARDVAARYPVTGGTVEEVMARDPDLVLASSFIAPGIRQAYEQSGIAVASFGIAATPAESYAQIRELARILGQSARGEALIKRIELELDSYKAGPGDARPSAVLWQQGQIVPGEATLVSDLLRRAGFSSHSARRGKRQADLLSLEEVLADPPDVLLVAGDARGQHHPALAGLEHTQIAVFDPSLFYCAGPTMVRAMERLAEIRETAG